MGRRSHAHSIMILARTVLRLPGASSEAGRAATRQRWKRCGSGTTACFGGGQGARCHQRSVNLSPPVHLAGDIGGTKTLLGLFTPERGPRHPVELATLATGDFRGAGALLGRFLDRRKIDGATLGVAGAVLNDGARGPNLPWEIERTDLSRALGGTPVRLLNDLEAIATFVPELESRDLVVLAEGVPTEHGPIGVIAPGTGIGQAMLLWGRGGYHAVASEAGHIDFAPNTALQDDTWLSCAPVTGT